ncbi:MAG: ABC transporter substrate-binding protein [Magnetococcales bacterium]|nr:ABC transporter substrate-binding protein [Magnetococcales bacterium]
MENKQINTHPCAHDRSLPLPPLLATLILIAGMLFSLSGMAAPVLRVGTNVWPGYEPLYLAQDLARNSGDREWAKNVRLVEYPSATEVLRAFRNKALEAAALTLDEVLVLKQARIPVKVILVMDVSHGGDVILAQKEIQTFSDLKGKRIAVESSALGAYVLTRALTIHGLSLDEIEIAHTDVSAHEEAFLAGQVDAAVTFEPVRTKLLKAGARELFTSREIPNEVVDVLVVHEEALKSHRQSVQKMVSGWFGALDYFEDQPKAAATILARRLKLTPAEVLASFDGLHLPNLPENHQMIGGTNPSLTETLKRLRETMVSQDLLSPRVNPKGLLTSAHLP